MKLLRPLVLLLAAFATANISIAAEPLILDMVHHNPGEPRFETRYEDPRVIKEMGYNGKVYFLFDAPTIAIDWETVDPEIFPKGSPGRTWVNQKAAQIDAQQTACRAAGVATYAMADLVLLPKALVKKYGIEKTYGDPNDPQTQKFLRLMVEQIFRRFPNFDGLVVRIGETYLQDAPYHKGHINNPFNADKTIIPLMQLLREEVCVKLNKEVIFRSWMSFDTKLETYRKISDAVEPHPRLVFGIKHCEYDFHRGNPFSKVLGEGRHKQLVEVQCAREYEGKGAYPNYIAHDVIEGFEEHRLKMPPEKMKSIRELTVKHPDLFAGVWTWTRGGGWDGPFITNELWCDLNAWVMAQWARDTTQSEEAVFNRYATERLGLKGDDVAKFRRLNMLSADAVIRGKNTTHAELSPWWTRDENINVPKIPVNRRERILAQKAESVRMWKEIAALAREINFPDAKTKEFAIVSADYGLHLHRIFQAVLELSDAGENVEKIRPWLKAYDDAWTDYRRLSETSAQCPTLYKEKGSRWARKNSFEPLEKFIKRMRQLIDTEASGAP